MRNLHLKVLALGLTIVGVAVCLYKVNTLGLPLKPGQETEVWTIQARLIFEGRSRPTKVEFVIPNHTPGFTILNEDFISANYGLAIEEEGLNRKAQWAIRRAKGRQVLYYRVSLARGGEDTYLVYGPTPQFPQAPTYPEPYDLAIKSILDNVRSESADVATYTQSLLLLLNAESPSENVKLLRQQSTSPEQWVYEITEVLAGAHIPSRVLYGLRVTDSVNNAELHPWLQVHNGQRWLAFNPFTGERGLPDDFLVWRVGMDPIARVEGSGPAEVIFSATRNYREVVDIARQRAEKYHGRMMDFSLFNLPVQTQNVYRILLTVPLGALLIVILRNLIGFRTFGTFMPILIAMAFRETQLLWGVVLFTLIVAFGLMMRFYLDKLMLLLVPRLASVLIIVVLMMMFVSMVSHQFGAERALSVALFPMVIMAMTIERMSIVWEESGAQEALLQGGGSLLAAVVGFLVMTNPLLTHLVFVFPELLLIVLAVTLLLGRYTGYRLSELWRFRSAIQSHKAKP